MSPVTDLLGAAVRAGHTVLPVDVVLRTCSRADVATALSDGDVVEVEWAGAPALALPEVADNEEMLADGLTEVIARNGLAVVVGSDPEARSSTLANALSGVAAVVLDDAHLVGIDDVLAAVEDLPEESVLALSLDPTLPLAAVPGAVALDLAASGVCPVLKATEPTASSALDRARADVASGAWFTTSGDDRSCVEVRVSGPDEALVRVGQLVTTSVPRAFDVAPSSVGILLAPGSLDADAVRASFDGTGVTPDVVALTGPLDRGWDAVVLVLGVPGPALTRSLVYAGLRAGRRHASVVHGADPAALATAMSGPADRPRRTRLAALLAP